MRQPDQSYDVIIIGGGLAGLTLSIQLAKTGIHVALFEKDTYPFHKVCGEYIAMESWNYLVECGIPLSDMNLPRIRKLHITSPSGTLLKHELNPGGFGISRYTLDSMLADKAVECGVDLYTGTKVIQVVPNTTTSTVHTYKGKFSAPLIMGSFGKKSNLDVSLSRNFIKQKPVASRNFIAVKYHVLADLPADLIGLHHFNNGYCGISKVDHERYCLCYLTTAENLNNSGNDIRKMEERVLMRNPCLKSYFTNYPSCYDEPLVISQIRFEPKPLVDDGIIMLGDAAGLITPLCGNGMSMALHASRMLSTLVPRFVNGELSRMQLEEFYGRQWRQQFSTRLKAGRMLQKISGQQYLTNAVIMGLKPFPFLVNKLVSLTHGDSF